MKLRADQTILERVSIFEAALETALLNAGFDTTRNVAGDLCVVNAAEHDEYQLRPLYDIARDLEVLLS